MQEQGVIPAYPRHLPGDQRLPGPLGLDLQLSAHADQRRDLLPGALRDQDLPAGRVRLDASRQIDGGAPRSELHAPLRADVTDDYLPGVDADAHLDLGKPRSRLRAFTPSIASCMARAQATARSASWAAAVGAPKMTRIPSPIISLMVPR